MLRREDYEAPVPFQRRCGGVPFVMQHDKPYLRPGAADPPRPLQDEEQSQCDEELFVSVFTEEEEQQHQEQQIACVHMVQMELI